MESHSYEKTGEGVPPSTSDQCSFIDSKGACCRMFATENSALCPHHARQEVARQRRQNHAVAQALLADSGDLGSPDCVVRFLGNLLREVAHKRVDRRDAVTMAYVAQLLMNSQAAFSRFVDQDLKVQDAAMARFIDSQRTP